MGDGAHMAEPLEVGFEVYGVRAVLTASDGQLLASAIPLLPPEARSCAPDSPARFAVIRDAEDGYRVIGPRLVTHRCRDRELAMGLLEAELHLHVAMMSANRIFIHAGVVVVADRAIVIPGAPMSGKTTLVEALVRRGAGYFSDEYAFLDEAGLVHPYAQPLQVRQDGGGRNMQLAQPPGRTRGVEPVPVGLVVLTSYRPGAHWKPEERSRGQGVLGLLLHAAQGRDRPAESMAVIRAALQGAKVLEGERGEADDAARGLLEIAEETARGPAAV